MEACLSGWRAGSSSSGPEPAFSPPVSPHVGATARFAAGRADPSAPAKLILASTSPRRRHVLETVGLSFFVHPVDIDERPRLGEGPERLALRLATEKALAGSESAPGAIVLGADTVVALDARALGKPESAADARRMLEQLRGRAHRVITAVAVARTEAHGQPVHRTRVSSAEVTMRAYSDPEIDRYVASGDPLDKAGAYAIQDPTFRPVEGLNGCYLTVVGLALPEVYELLAEAGLEVPAIAPPVLEQICPGCIDSDRLPLTGRPVSSA